MDYFEINEVFSLVLLANNIKLCLNTDNVNVFGGAVAISLPLGCSGAGILTTLLNVLSQKGGTIGMTGICNGRGGASAIAVQKI